MSIRASEEGNSLLGSTTNFYIEFTLLPTSRAEPQETQGYFCLPCSPNEQLILDHKHTWDMHEESVYEALLSESAHVQFALVGEPVENAGDGEADCEDFG